MDTSLDAWARNMGMIPPRTTGLDKQSIKAIASQLANSGNKRVHFDDDDTKDDSGSSDEEPLKKKGKSSNQMNWNLICEGKHT